MGARVEGRFGGGDDYYGGVVVLAHADGSVDVAYDDGDKEERVSPSLVRPLTNKAQQRDEASSSGEDDASEEEEKEAVEESDGGSGDENTVR